MAREIPVLPLVASRMIRSGVSSPDSSAASIIRLAMRSFSEPVGLSPSSFAHRRTDGFGDIRGMPTSRVFPMASRMSLARTAAIIPGKAVGLGKVVGAPLRDLEEVPRSVEVLELLFGPSQGGVCRPLAGLVLELLRPAEDVPAHQLDPSVDGDRPR